MTVYFLMLVALIVAAWLIIRKINANKRHPLLTANLICGAVLGSCVFLMCMEEAYLSDARLLYDGVYNGGILDEMKYTGTEDGYHVVYAVIGFGIRGSIEIIEIPEEQASVSFISKLYKPVILYCMGGKEWKDAVKIVPDFFPLEIGTALIDIAACILLNLAVLIRMLYRLLKRAKKTDT